MFDRPALRLFAYRRCTIFDCDHVVSQFITCAHCGFDATVREKTTQGDRIDLPASEDEIEIGCGETVQASLAFHNDITRLRFQNLNDLRTPASFFKDLALLASFQYSVRIS